MTDIVPIRRALLSVSDKTDLVPFARGLRERGVTIVSTGGTARALTEAGLEVIPVETVTGFPEMMDGRVKTLHPSIHGAVLARRDLESHQTALSEHGIESIDLVCINLYPFERTVQRDDVTDDEAIEQIDIGGPALLRSAAKNHAFVSVVTSANQYDQIIRAIESHDGTTYALRRELAAAAFARTAEYDTTISTWMSQRLGDTQAFPPLLQLSYVHHGELRYGENPHQHAAVYAHPAARGTSVIGAPLLAGKPLSYNNLNDAASALRAVQDLAATFPARHSAVIVKHTNPCGAAVAESLEQAFDDAYAGDPLAAYGGILALSSPVDTSTARRIAEDDRFLEVIVAPAFEDGAAPILAERWKNVRLLAVGKLDLGGKARIDYRTIPGGLLAQERDSRLASVDAWRHAAGPEPDAALLDTAALTWTIAKHLTSNAIAIGGRHRLLGAGAGQTDRLTACRLAVEKAGAALTEAGPAVAASDAFFPFRDGPEVLIDAGVRCLVQPGGSRRDQETFDLCDERGVTCLLTGVRHFRHG